MPYNGKMVAVRGVLRGTDEGVWLAGEGCADVLKSPGYQWKSLIWLVRPGSSFVLHENVAIKEDREALALMDKKIRQKSKNPDKDKIWVTYVGLLETWGNIRESVFVGGNGKVQGGGFGHVGLAPAQIVVKTVKDVVIEPYKK